MQLSHAPVLEINHSTLASDIQVKLNAKILLNSAPLDSVQLVLPNVTTLALRMEDVKELKVLEFQTTEEEEHST